MSISTAEQKLLLPSNRIIKEATLTAFKKMNGIDMAAAENFLNEAGTGAAADIITTKATLAFFLLYGHVTITPISNYTNCKFDHDFWGVGVGGGESIGIMYTAYSNWDAFFREVTSFHIQGIADGGGFLQVNFFRSDALPIGQFNGVLEGIGVFQGGNPGRWAC